MPNRIIKESICTSEDYRSMSLFQRDLFFRLIVSADDFGRFDGRPDIIRGRLYPLELDKVTKKSIEDALTGMASIGVVKRYIVDEKPYLCLSSWQAHQQQRSQSSKYPDPKGSESECNQLISDDINCNQVISDVPENENENENDILSCKPDIVHEVVSYLNQKIGANFKATTESTRRHISARVKEGFELEDFKKVIDNRCEKWGSDPKMKEYLRPKTLFGTNFESYLNDPSKKNISTSALRFFE